MHTAHCHLLLHCRTLLHCHIHTAALPHTLHTANRTTAHCRAHCAHCADTTVLTAGGTLVIKALVCPWLELSSVYKSTTAAGDQLPLRLSVVSSAIDHPRVVFFCVLTATHCHMLLHTAACTAAQRRMHCCKQPHTSTLPDSRKLLPCALPYTTKRTAAYCPAHCTHTTMRTATHCRSHCRILPHYRTAA
jgi:hypothetical protein